MNAPIYLALFGFFFLGTNIAGAEEIKPRVVKPKSYKELIGAKQRDKKPTTMVLKPKVYRELDSKKRGVNRDNTVPILRGNTTLRPGESLEDFADLQSRQGDGVDRNQNGRTNNSIAGQGNSSQGDLNQTPLERAQRQIEINTVTRSGIDVSELAERRANGNMVKELEQLLANTGNVITSDEETCLPTDLNCDYDEVLAAQERRKESEEIARRFQDESVDDGVLAPTFDSDDYVTEEGFDDEQFTEDRESETSDRESFIFCMMDINKARKSSECRRVIKKYLEPHKWKKIL